MDGLPIPLVDGKPVVSLEGEELLDVEVLYDEIRADGIGSETFHQVIRVKATQDPAEVKPNGEVITWTSIQQSGKTLAEATQLMDKRDIDGALDLLNSSIKRLQSLEGVEGLEDAIDPLLRLHATIERGLYNRGTRKRTVFESREAYLMKSASHWSSDAPRPHYKYGRTIDSEGDQQSSPSSKTKTDQQ